MGAIPAQMAATLPADRIRVQAEVAAVESNGARLTSGESIQARAVVLATDGTTLGEWVAGFPRIESRAVTCLYFAADTSPLDDPILVLNGTGNGLINNLCVPSDVSPRCAPAGASLISVTVLGNSPMDDATLRDAVHGKLKSWFGGHADRWKHLTTYRIAHALPETGPQGLADPARSVRLKQGLYPCGDHRETPSIEGALRSGRRAAAAVVQDLAEGGKADG